MCKDIRDCRLFDTMNTWKKFMPELMNRFCARGRLAKTVRQIKYFKQPAGIGKPDAINHKELMLRPSALYLTSIQAHTHVHSA